MARQVTLRVLTLLCLFFCVNKAIANQTDDDHDHDHDHNHEEESAFEMMVEAITGSHSEVLSDAGASKLLETLRTRFHVEEIQKQCFEKIQTTLSNDNMAEYDETSFLETAQVILQNLINGSCEHDHANLTFGGSSMCKDEVENVIRQLETTYEQYTSEVCFSEHTILAENCTSENSEVVYSLLTNLFQGNCILPSKSDLIDNLFHYMGVEGEVVYETNFETLLSNLQIGSSSDSHSDHSHEEGNHDHFRKKRNADETTPDPNHDHDHDHEHEHDHVEPACYSENQLRSIYGYYGNMTREQVISMCPTLLEQILGGVCSSTTNEDNSDSPPLYTTAMKYGYGTLAVFIISLLALIGIIFFPVVGSNKFALTMQFFMALGVGAMSGDVIFHILPDILGVHSHGAEPENDDHDHEGGVPDYVWKLLVVLVSIWAMFIFENALKLSAMKTKSQTHNNDFDSSLQGYDNKEAIVEVTNFSDSQPETRKSSLPSSYSEDSSVNDKISSTSETRKTYFWGITSTGIMVFLGDLLHNFGDGIALGAAFSVSWPQGVGTAFAVGFHELPHELGDFAIYLNNGVSKSRALLLNFMAACFSFLGLYIALALSEDPGVRTWLLAVVAGNFLYISFVDVLKEMVEEKTSNPKIQFVLQNLGLFVGWTLLFILTIYEDALISILS